MTYRTFDEWWDSKGCRYDNLSDVPRQSFAAGMAVALDLALERYRWRPITEMHEDFGPCVLININHRSIDLGNNLSPWYDESDWTHFTQITPLTTEQAEKLKAEMP